VEIEGSLVAGAGRGRKMSIPTLNLKSENELIPGMGVYISRISLDGRPFMDGVTNIGVRPTFGEDQLTIETFVLNEMVPEDAVTARLDFFRRLRQEIKFESPDALVRQITIDVRRAKTFFRLVRTKHA
jgi:riboflavin kinase/FMN adenylyltransferase